LELTASGLPRIGSMSTYM